MCSLERSRSLHCSEVEYKGSNKETHTDTSSLKAIGPACELEQCSMEREELNDVDILNACHVV